MVSQYKEAAQILAGVNVDSPVLGLTVEQKTDLYIRCAESSLEACPPRNHSFIVVML